MYRYYLLIVVFVLLETGCAVHRPHLHLNRKQVISAEGPGNCFNIDCRVKVFPITPELIRQMRRDPPPARSNPYLSSQIKSYDYHIGIGDILNIIVWEHPELTTPAGQYRGAAESGNWVQSDGTIYYPYIGKVQVAGKTLSEARSIVSRRLEKFIKEPQVAINIASFRSQKVFITGEVNQPGQQYITNIPLTVLGAINQAGGLSQNADWQHVKLTRHGVEQTLSLQALMQYGDLTQNKLLSDTDIIHVPRDDYLKVFVMGEVKSPQQLHIDRAGMSLSEVLSRAGGLDNQFADAKGIFVIRPRFMAFKQKQQTIANIYQFDNRDAASLVLATVFQIQPYDVVYVTASPVALWNRAIADLMPALNVFNALQSPVVLTLGANGHG